MCNDALPQTKLPTGLSQKLNKIRTRRDIGGTLKVHLRLQTLQNTVLLWCFIYCNAKKDKRTKNNDLNKQSEKGFIFPNVKHMLIY